MTLQKIRFFIPALVLMLMITECDGQDQFQLQNGQLVINSKGKSYQFSPKFTILFREDDPKMAMRPARIEEVPYNVVTWLTYKGQTGDLEKVERDISQEGDGFDSKILDAKTKNRTPNFYKSGQYIQYDAISAKEKDGGISFEFQDHELFSFRASVKINEQEGPMLVYQLTPKVEGYFSVGYSGAPGLAIEEAEEIWQPIIWQEKRFPNNSYMTLAFRASVPTTLVNDGVNSIGVLASPDEFPFDPLPTLKNSRFGVVVRDYDGKAKPQLFAPVMGGVESKMEVGDTFAFKAHLIVDPQDIPMTYEKIARDYFDFRDFRQNELVSLNKTFENLVKYSMTDYSRYVDSLKGFAYSTDVPGAVKNVSSLNPLEIALVMDNKNMFDKRAYPMMEYMISREKFLFSLDPEQKIQHPSRALKGPIAPISEMVSLYNVFGQTNSHLVELAKNELTNARIRNLDVKESGESWINFMHIYKATNDPSDLKKAIQGADKYISERVESRQEDFTDPFAKGFFFWTSFTSRWIELLELYEISGEERFLKAAHDGARHYTMVTWMSPRIPDEKILVNKGGLAPHYSYLRYKGHEQMKFPEENVDAWRLSEMGLTPESSGTSQGHRAIFMANYAPWMLRLGHYTNDLFLREVAKSAIIGRYRNFPGYHINTARTTAYEKADYPYREHKELSVNSFHYNHIMPMASMLLDYLVTDVYVRSDGEINFPSEFIEGYAYMVNKFYGAETGKFYDETDVRLWMPADLLKTSEKELNYISARKGNRLYLAFANQSDRDISATIFLNKDLAKLGNTAKMTVWENNEDAEKRKLKGDLQIDVSADGITAIMIEGVKLNVSFQESLLAESKGIDNTYKELTLGDARAMIFNMGAYARKAFVYLREDDSKWDEILLTYSNKKGNEVILKDEDYPFEFTLPFEKDQSGVLFTLRGTTNSGTEFSEEVLLGELK